MLEINKIHNMDVLEGLKQIDYENIMVIRDLLFPDSRVQVKT